ncbi:MAG TPA: sugar diacid recognition domain-containing protein [Negativicutes bacterium]|jgi:carbohydrate diacid regulator
MILTSELAQQIVDKIMPIVNQNINIMNNTGAIIGSGHKHRLNSFHQGAKDAIENGAVVEIYPEDLNCYPGSLPGLNWPIMLGEQIVGVVGISGHPNAVRSTAALVKMVTELILEREILMEEFRSQSHLHEQFALHLLSDQASTNFSQIKSRANLLRFDLSLPRLVAVTSVSPILEIAYNNYGLYDLISSRTRESLLQLLTTSTLISSKDLIAFLENQLIIFKYFPKETTVHTIKEWSIAFWDLIQLNNPDTPLQLGVGSLVNSPLELYDSYREAQYVLKNSYHDANVSSIYDFNLLASYLVQEPRAVNFCTAFKALQEKLTKKFDSKYNMRNTLQILLENNLNISATAKALFIHRNTLVFRLEKLKLLLGLCPSQYLNHAILCKILCNEPYKIKND